MCGKQFPSAKESNRCKYGCHTAAGCSGNLGTEEKPVLKPELKGAKFRPEALILRTKNAEVADQLVAEIVKLK